MKKIKELFGNEKFPGLKKFLRLMKLTVFFILISVGCVLAGKTYSQTKMLTLHIENATVKEVLTEIESQSEFHIMYSGKFVDVDREVSLDVENQKIESVLNTLFAGTDVSYTVKDRFIVLVTSELMNEGTLAMIQQQAISGKVTDIGGQPLPGVTVVVKGTTRGTVTNADGDYSLTNIPEDATLVFSFVGMETQEVEVGNQTSINVTMVEEAIGLKEVVAIGYGTQTKRDITGSVQSIDVEKLDNLPVAQIGQKLQGQTAGVEILQTTGKPGQGMSIRVRGAASINASNDPLYVIDGFPIVGDISNINPDEIETISILKDASATSLYGSRAANGVVLIQTKQGKRGETQISFNAYYGIQSVPQKGRPDMMNAREFATFQKEIREGYADYTGTTANIPEEYKNPSQYGKGTDWYDVLLRNAPIQNYNLSITANKDKLRTSVIGGYLKQDGVLLNSSFSRYSLRINTEYDLNDKIKVGVNLAPNHAISESPNSDGVVWNGGIIQSAILTSPIAKAVNDDGTLPLTANSPGLFPNPNWYRVVQEVKNDKKATRLLSNAYVEIELLDGLKFKSSANIDLSSSQLLYFSPSTSGGIFAPPPQKTNARIEDESYYSWLTENTLTYTKTFNNEHNLDVLFGYTAQKYRFDSNTLNGTDFPDDEVTTLSAAATTTGTSDIQEWSLLSWVSRINYIYKDKYLISLAMRSDGSSRFGPDNRWGNFPSVSAGWIVSEEDFMKSIDMLSYLKLRSSYGITGNNNIGNYSYYAAVNSQNYVFNNVLANGKATTSLSNSELGWEKTSMLNIGVDIGLFKNRFFFQYDYFRKYTSDMLNELSVPQASGFDQFVTNAGEFKFWGHEFLISSKNMVRDFKWNTDFNISFVRNKVIDLGPDIDFIGGLYGDPHITKVGQPIGMFIGYVFDGIYNNQAELDAAPKHATSTVGTVRMKNTNGDNVIDDNDRTIIGNPSPKFTFGLTNSFNYKNIDLNIIISGAYGNKIMNRTLEYIQNLDGVFNVTKDIANRWRSPENPGEGVHPRAMVGTALARDINSRWVSDGSYATIKNITLGYTIPTQSTLKYFKSIRLYTSIQQPLVLTKYDGSNPEVNINGGDALAQGIDWSVYPVPRTVSFGFNLNF
jgi:TonB-linked SusC/RagA family outer membrane protein